MNQERSGMSDLQGDNAVDQRVRRALEPDPAVVERTVEAALRTSRRTVWIPWAATATAVLALALVALFSRSPDVIAPPPRRVLTISNEHGLVTVTTPEGGRFVVSTRDAS